MLKKSGLFGALLLVGVSAMACNQGGKTASAPAEGADAPAEGADAPAIPKGPCGKYAAALCTEAGETSPTCASVKAATDIMPPAACTAGMKDMAFSKAAITKQRAACQELVTKLCADLGPDTNSCKMVTEKTPSFPPERCASMMGQYDQVLKELKAEEAKNKPLDAAAQAKLASGSTLTFGPKDAPVTVVEFSDFQCPYCSRAADAVDAIKKKYPDNVRVVFRQFPLGFHKEAHLAAQASAAAGAQGKFWQYHDLLFKNQKALSRPDLEKYAKEVGLNMKQFNKALDDGTYKASVDADMALGEEVHVRGTPTMFVNGQRVANPTDTAMISTAIDGALAKNKK